VASAAGDISSSWAFIMMMWFFAMVRIKFGTGMVDLLGALC